MVFGEISFEVDTSKYKEWTIEVRSRFENMVETMTNVARIIELETIPLVPLDEGTLEQSYDFQIVPSSTFIIMGVGYDAVDEKSGFHYAEYQHENKLRHPKRGTQFYLTKGIHNSQGEWMELIGSDYLSLFTGVGFSKGSIGKNNSQSGWAYKSTYRSFEWK